MHEGLQIIMSRLMFNECLINGGGITSSIQNYIKFFLLVSNYNYLLKLYVLLITIVHSEH
jgi:hypothetical protein